VRSGLYLLASTISPLFLAAGIGDDVFEAAQRRRGVRAKMTGRQQQPVKRLLSGLLRCGACEAGVSKKDLDHGRPRIICSGTKGSATCGNRRAYYVDEIELIVVH
jgi:site-specific DNA recombinase